MSESKASDLDSFKSEVLGEVERLKNLASFESHVEWARNKRASLKREGFWWVVWYVMFFISEKLQARLARNLRRDRRIDSYTEQAKELLDQPSVKQSLCSALQGTYNNAAEIAKVITPILVSMVTARAISTSLDPLLFAVSAQVIAQLGISEFCAG